MSRSIIIMLTVILVSCNFNRNDKNATFIYKGELFQIELENLSEDDNKKAYILYDSIKINKNEIKGFVINFPEDIYRRNLDELYSDEDEEWYLDDDQYPIKINQQYIEDNSNVFR